MRKMKKLFTLLIAVVMVMAMSITAYAADTHTIQITKSAESGETTNHEYTVYQLFVGELTTVDGKSVLSNIRYGTAGLGKEGDAVPEETLNAITDAEAYAQSVIKSVTNPYGTLSASNEFKLLNVPTGYYLIVDDTSKTLTDGDSYSKYIVEVVEDVNIAPKSEKVTSGKKEYDDSVTKTNVNEAGVGSVVSYELTAKIAENADIYDYYNFILCDTLSAGLTFNNDITVTIGVKRRIVSGANCTIKSVVLPR